MGLYRLETKSPQNTTSYLDILYSHTAIAILYDIPAKYNKNSYH